MTTLSYRPEIDGLRAIAVLAVIFYHAKWSLFQAGFVGVDIFFVISGYLISRILLYELTQQSFRLSHFYERRARRILPALFVVIFFCIPLAWQILLPYELVNFGESVISSVFFVANILFWQQSDYFSADANIIPLLHTWSLAVEEQYYLLFPLLFKALWLTIKKHLMLVISILALLSLACAEYLWRVDPSANFYLLPSRLWELLLGVLLVLYLQPTNTNVIPFNPLIRQLGSLFGLLLIIISIFLFDNSLPFPSIYALIPTLGSALIILCAYSDTWVGRLLAWRVLVGIGLISYSAYLWHQPLLAFAQLTDNDSFPPTTMVILTLLLAYITWYLVERPFRQASIISRQWLIITCSFSTLLLILMGSSFILFSGFDSRFLD